MSFLGLHVQIHVGRMLHSHKKRKGVLVPHDTPVQIMLHKNCSYGHMVERCRKEVFPDDDADDATAHYYVANSTGACIASGEVINMDGPDGTEHNIPWTLETYLKCSRNKYPSRARFYCVKRIG